MTIPDGQALSGVIWRVVYSNWRASTRIAS